MKATPSPSLTRLLGALALVLATGGCSLHPDPSIIRTKTIDSNVENGIAHDEGFIPIEANCRVLVVPPNAEIERSGDLDKIHVLLVKEVAIMAHPSDLISVSTVRKQMGVGYTFAQGRLTLGTYGEFVNSGHGGATMKMKVAVPARIAIERWEKSSGVDSVLPRELEEPGRKQHEGWTKLVTTPVKAPPAPAIEAKE